MKIEQSIIRRVQQFLAGIEPFRYFSEEDLLTLCQKTVVSVYYKDEMIFRRDEHAAEHFYLVRKGAVEILEQRDNVYRLVDRCGEADIFGIRPTMANTSYLYDARCQESTIIYEIPVEQFKLTYRNYPRAVDFVVQRFAAGRTFRDAYEPVLEEIQVLQGKTVMINPERKSSLVSITKESTVAEAARLMDDHKVSCVIVVNDDGHPIGILTDRDMRRMVALELSSSASVQDHMSSPVYCIEPRSDLLSVQLEMVRHSIKQICVTEDGTSRSPAINVVSQYDVLYAKASDPLVTMRRIIRARNTVELKAIRDQIDRSLAEFANHEDQSRLYLSLINQLNAQIWVRCCELTLEEYNESAAMKIDKEQFCFFSMGSVARREQLTRTDQDHGIVYLESQESRQTHYMAFAKILVEHLSELGYLKCSAEMMSSNPDWCLSVSEMKERISSWFLRPEPQALLDSSTFLDFRVEFGNQDLSSGLVQHIRDLYQRNPLYYNLLAEQTVKTAPPLSFFRKFIVEKNGDHAERFDIKGRAIAPLIDAVRVLAIDTGFFKSSNTLDRLDHLATAIPEQALLFRDCQESLLHMMRLRLERSLLTENGRWIDPKAIPKIDRLRLRRAFKSTQRLQELLSQRYAS